jgi:maltose alpha-D-glucosyltransferase/alpha-amylase
MKDGNRVARVPAAGAFATRSGMAGGHAMGLSGRSEVYSAAGAVVDTPVGTPSGPRTRTRHEEVSRLRRPQPTASVQNVRDPQWYRDAVFYEVHVRAFFDSDGDGSGDFRGLTQKLDYLRDLGVTALWVLPFYPSPMRDDGYDIADYTSVNPAFGTLRDVETLIREAHKRGLRIVTELVCNHTSDQHPWFQRARRARPGTAAREFYVWSDSPDRYPDARIIFKDFESSNWTWDPVAGAYYWHRFYSHQPDLNFDNPRVRAAITRVVDFWLDRGVDGLRLDAVPYLYERDGTDCENLPETHEFLKALRRHVDARYGDRMLLGEANQWPEEAAAYFGDGDECHMAFNFPVMPRMFMALRMEDRLPIVDIVEQTPAIPVGAQWALFLRNHDELTLEMVTDEERDYMYRVYAGDPRARVNLGIRRRLAPLLGNHRRRIELMNGLLFSLPGTPVIYYGDEIGMGDNFYLGDRDSVRTPMQWSGDRNAGFSTAERERLYLPVVTDPEHHFEAVNVSVQQANPHSLLWWTKRLIALRKRHPAFGRGEMRMLHPDNRHVLAFVRRLGDETILVVANLSRFFQPVELDLAEFEGRQPVEMFGRIEFPAIGELPYLVTLGPHEFLWLVLEQPPAPSEPVGLAVPSIRARGVEDLLDGHLDGELTSILMRWARDQGWYRGHGRRQKDGEIVDRVEIPLAGARALLIALRVNYSDGEPDTYLIPLTTASVRFDSLVYEDGLPCRIEPPGLRIASLAPAEGTVSGAYLVDASAHAGLTAHLVDVIARHRRVRGRRGSLQGRPDAILRGATGAAFISANDAIRSGEVFDVSHGAHRGPDPRDLTLELRHAFEPGADPEAEVMRFLTGHGATWAPRVFGELEYRPEGSAPGSGALLRETLVHDGDLAAMTRHELLAFLEQAAAMARPSEVLSITAPDLIRASRETPPEVAADLMGSYLETARSIGGRIGEFHAAMASATDDPAFAPEPFSRLYQASLYQAIDVLAIRVTRLLAARATELDLTKAIDAGLVLGLRPDLKERLRPLLDRRFSGSRIRVHGALGLDRVMRAERGLVMIDFEGDTSRPASERRLKRSPLRDVAAMIRSFHQVALGRLRETDVGGSLRPEDLDALDVWARYWQLWVAAALLRGYRETAGETGVLPVRDDEWAWLLDTFLLHGALDELYSDLRNAPERVQSSIRGLLEVLGR